MIPDNPLIIIPLSSGIIFLIVGLYTLYYPPKKINDLYGYRTAASMKNQKRWDFAQVYASKAMIKVGLILCCIAALGLLYQPNGTLAMILGLGFMLVGVFYLFFKVERKIKSEFSKND